MFTAVAELLPLPRLDGLTDQQRRGAVCVWDADHGPLSTPTAIDLGEWGADGTTLFLRGCKACALPLVMDALQRHSPDCRDCTADYRDCATGLALVRLGRVSGRDQGAVRVSSLIQIIEARRWRPAR
ncbi:hypothetical protein ACGFX8_37845, partial [Streptomyces sp. NPDC048362]|uniref:hypothetical protein n=1 Tax=Streptomyces sp. NPDC048362 TaxID=3365539 RepID=UPI003713A5D5